MVTHNPELAEGYEGAGNRHALHLATRESDGVADDGGVSEGRGVLSSADMPHDQQTDITPKVTGGQYDATFADSTVIGYTLPPSGAWPSGPPR